MSEGRREAASGCGCCGCADPERRRAMGLALAAGAVAALPVKWANADEGPSPDKMPPQPGDLLVFTKGDRRHEPITAADLAENDAALEAWPMDPLSETVRRRSRLNRVLLIKLDPSSLDEKTAARGVDGIIAYSAFCTHAGCFIESYMPDKQVIYCHCHNSMFDPRSDGKVTEGPAKAPLAALPIKLDGDNIVVAGEFEGFIGIAET